jgi:hypothetical protein
MTDAVALTAVVSTGLVALVGLGVAFQMTREQRRHDLVRARAERVWSVEAEGMADLVATCRSLVDALDRPGSFDAIAELDLERGDYEATVREHVGVSEIGVRVGDVVRRLHELVAVVELYGSPECRKAFAELRWHLRDSGYDPTASDRLAAIRRGKTAAIESKDYRSAATARRLERELLEEARNRLDVDLDRTRELAEQVITATRESFAVEPESTRPRGRRRGR